MVEYKCYNCDKMVGESYLKNRIRCPYCNGKMMFKQKMTTTHVKAR